MNRLYLIFLVCGYAVWGQDCSSPSALTHYKVEKFVKKKQQLDDPKYLNDMKSELIRQISTAVSVREKSYTHASDSKESSKYTSKIDVTSNGLIINPQIDICVDQITMSVEKKFIHDLSRNYLTKVIGSDTKSILALIRHSSTTNKTFLKEQYKSFRTKEKYYAGLIPLALESKEDFSLEDYEDFKSALYLLGSKANSTVVTRATTYVRSSVKKEPRKSNNTSYKKPKTIKKQSAGYYKTRTTYSSYKKGITVQAKAGFNLMKDFVSDNTRMSRVYNLDLLAGDVTFKDGSVPIGIGLKYLENSKGKTNYKEIEYEDDLMSEDLAVLYLKAGFSALGFEFYMTYGGNINKLETTYNNRPDSSSSLTLDMGETKMLEIGYGVSIPLNKRVTLYGHYANQGINYFKPRYGTDIIYDSHSLSFGLNFNIN